MQIYLRNMGSVSVTAVIISTMSFTATAEQNYSQAIDEKNLNITVSKDSETPESRTQKRLEGLKSLEEDEDQPFDPSDPSLQHDEQLPSMSVSEATVELISQGVSQEGVSEEVLTPNVSQMNDWGMTRAKPIGALKAYDDDTDHPHTPPEDPNDPTSEGRGPHGSHKRGPQLLDPKMIRIIRMGEAPQESGGLMVVKSWDN